MHTKQLKQMLWTRFGSPEHPAEWDGNIYGGGRLSQRWWEYLMAIEMLSLSPDSRVLDLGGGSNKTGTTFLADLLVAGGVHVTVMDPDARGSTAAIVPEKCGYESLRGLLEREAFTHVVSVSALEHFAPFERLDVMRALDESFDGDKIVLTFEFAAVNRWGSKEILTTADLRDMTAYLTRYYAARMEKSPVWCQDAWPVSGPAWYPLAVCLEPMK